MIRVAARKLRCWAQLCPCISVNVNGGVCAECVDCGKQDHFVSSADIQAYIVAEKAMLAARSGDQS